MELDENCVQIILFYGSKGDLATKMAEKCKCERGLADDFINKYFTFLTKEPTLQPIPEVEPE